MIKLKNILKEFDFGDKLFADDAYGSSSVPYANLVSRMYNGEYEKDTKEEMALCSAIKDYLKSAKKDGVSARRDDIKELLSLKKQFPQMLDPATDINAGELIFRGMTAELDKIVEYIGQATRIHNWGMDSRWIMLKGVQATVTSRSNQGFISATHKSSTAIDFAQMNQRDNRYPILATSAYSKVASRSIIAPSFATVLAGYDEGEFWILGDKIQSQNLILANPAVYGRYSSREEGGGSGGILTAALKEKGYIVDRHM
jgi:hypothetical protein